MYSLRLAKHYFIRLHIFLNTDSGSKSICVIKEETVSVH